MFPTATCANCAAVLRAEIARAAGGEVATATQAREIPGVKNKKGAQAGA